MRRAQSIVALGLALSLVLSCSKHHSSGVSSSTPAPVQPSPVLVLDDAHNQALGNHSAYAVPATAGLVLDARDYRIAAPPRGDKTGPNAVHVVLGSTDYFRVRWNGKGTVALDSSSLSVVKGDGPFAGFQSGREYVIGVGVEQPSGGTPDLTFDVLWAGKVRVQ